MKEGLFNETKNISFFLFAFIVAGSASSVVADENSTDAYNFF